MNFRFLFYILACGLCMASCKKTPAPAPQPLPPAQAQAPDTTGSIDIVITNVVNDSALVFNTKKYVNANNDTFTVNILRYYFTNIVFKTAGGYTYTQPESYYLVDQSVPGSLTIHVPHVPRASYTSITYMIGVDKNRNTSGAQTGALDPGNGMFWTWNSGYIMAKFEGYSPQSGEATKKLVFHMGGFSGANNVIRGGTMSLPAAAVVSTTHTPVIHFKGDIAEWFKTPNTVSFSTLYDITIAGANAKSIADNYADMFTITSVVN